MEYHIKLALPILSLLFIITGCSPDNPPMLIGGVQVNESNLQKWVSTLNKAGMNTVEVTVYGRNGDWNSKWMKFESEEGYVLEEIRAAKKKRMKVVLILRMALDHYYPANKFLWHGMIFPQTEPDLNAWFETYTSFVEKWTQVAEKEKVDVLVIGSELNALAATMPTDTLPQTIEWFGDSNAVRLWDERVLKYQNRLQHRDLWVRGFPNYDDPRHYIRDKVRAHWQWAQVAGFGLDSLAVSKINDRRRLLLQKWSELINRTRSLYSGKLSFAANFDNYKEVAFWDQLDMIGINAYFPLRMPQASGEDTLISQTHFKRQWKSILAEIDTFRTQQGLLNKPVFFTELGYTYRKNASLRPWKADGFSVIGEGPSEQLLVWPDQEIDRRERTLAVRALYDAVKENRFPLAGILYWKLTTYPGHLKIEPFALHIAQNPTDSLQRALTRFLQLSPPP